jgi:hypothetical protein
LSRRALDHAVGLESDEWVAVLQVALRSGRAAGIDVTTFDPNLEPIGGPHLVDALVRGLTAVREADLPRDGHR